MSNEVIGLIIFLIVVGAFVVWHFLPKKDKREVRSHLKTRAEILKDSLKKNRE